MSAAGSSGTVGGDSGAAGAGGTGTPPCDTTLDPRAEACIVSDEYAVFVAPTGNDENPGTQGAPFATLSKAAEAAGDLPVLVCNATYDEHVVIANGVRIFGGFKCTDWSPETAKPLFKPSTAGQALKVDTVADVVLIDGVAFEVGDATAAGASALTAIVNASPEVTLRGVSLKAGKGKAGANGTLTSFTFRDQTALNGNPEGATMSGGQKVCACQSPLVSVGGVGGTPSSSGQSGAKGLPDHGGGAPGTPNSCGSGGTGQDGGDAPATAPGSGEATLGTPSVVGWLPTAGTDGANGSPGQGGGGGASRNDLGHGGGGGCGGCGGNGGTAGKGGGGSIALLALDSPLVLEASSIATADAGDGGGGAAGQAGQDIAGMGGTVASTFNSCAGGNGGKGGAGGAGGGGAGGVSVGVLWKGAAQPTVSADTTITNGKVGAKGVGGEPNTNDGIVGVAQKILQVN
jgi:hypothetical protein